MASFHSQDDINRALAAAADAGVGIDGTWFGAFRHSCNSGSDPTLWNYTSKNDFDFTDNWHPNEPNNYNGREACAMFSGNEGKWNDQNCENQYKVMCQFRA